MARFTHLAALYTLVLYSARSLCDDGAKLTPKITVNYFEPCPDYSQLPCRYENLSFYNDPDDDMMYVSGDLSLDSEIPDDTVLSVDFRKCMNEKAESCKNEFQLDVPDFCTQIPDKSKSWAPFVERIQNFDPNCPIKPGKFALNDAIINMTAMESTAGAMIGHWQAEVMFVSQDNVLGCMVLDMDITSRRLSI